MEAAKSGPLGAVVLVLGIVAILLAVLADPLGVGGNEDKFGWKQWVLLAVGVIAAGAGFALMRARQSPEPPPE